MDWAIIAAVNNEDLLRRCLLASPHVSSAEIIVQKGFGSAAQAYNDAIDRAQSEILVLCHQDMYLPEGWVTRLEQAVDQMTQMDPCWGVLGTWGVAATGERLGYMYCAGNLRVLGKAYGIPAPVRSLDEALLVIRRSSGLRFDGQVPGFHMYGTDICLEAELRGMKAYAVSAFCVHNTNGYNLLPWAFWKSYFYMRRKWRRHLPIETPCVNITRSSWPFYRWNVVQAANILFGRHQSGRRVDDPQRLYNRMVREGKIEPLLPAFCG